MSTYIFNDHLGTIGVKQISGLIFRRIANHVQEGQQLEAQQPIGEILFGSRVDIIIQAKEHSDFQLKVKKGDYLKGGKSVIGMYIGEY